MKKEEDKKKFTTVMTLIIVMVLLLASMLSIEYFTLKSGVPQDYKCFDLEETELREKVCLSTHIGDPLIHCYHKKYGFGWVCEEITEGEKWLS